MLCFTLKNLKILPISSKNLILEFHRQGNLWLSRRGKETKWNAKKETVNGVVKLISQMVYVRINNFAQWGLKIVDDFSWHKYCSKYISRALGVSVNLCFHMADLHLNHSIVGEYPVLPTPTAEPYVLYDFSCSATRGEYQKQLHAKNFTSCKYAGFFLLPSIGPPHRQRHQQRDLIELYATVLTVVDFMKIRLFTTYDFVS